MSTKTLEFAEIPRDRLRGGPETHTYEFRAAGDCMIPIVYRVANGALTSYTIEDGELARARGCGYQEWFMRSIAEAHRAGWNTSRGKWPR